MHLDLEGGGGGGGWGVGVGGVGDWDGIEGLNDGGSGAEGLNWEDACQA